MVADIAQNAIEADASLISVSIIQSKTFFVFYVKDNGHGMTQEQIRLSKSPFYTDATKHPSREIGLGIPFLAQTVEITGGDWKISSELGKGTEVYAKINLAHIDVPPVGDIAGLIRLLVTMPDMKPTTKDCDIEVTREYKGEVNYKVIRSQLQQELGPLDRVETLSLIGKYLKSQENAF